LYKHRPKQKQVPMNTEELGLPLFQGCVFCRLNEERRLPVLTIPGVLHFAGVGKTPVRIDDQEIAAIQTAVRLGLWTEPWLFLEVGQRVRLEDGPLAGGEGLLIEVRKQHRLVVLVTLLRRSVAVEIERDWVKSRERTMPAPATYVGCICSVRLESKRTILNILNELSTGTRTIGSISLFSAAHSGAANKYLPFQRKIRYEFSHVLLCTRYKRVRATSRLSQLRKSLAQHS